MKKVSIIGLGWLGMPLAEQLQRQGLEVKGSKRQPLSSNVVCYPLDLAGFTPTQLAPLLDCDCLIITVPPSANGYVAGIKRIVCLAITQEVAHIIFISSTALLPKRSGCFDEQSPIEVENAPQLAELEQWLQHQPIACDIVRFAGLVGKQRHPVYYLAGKQNLAGAAQPVNLVHLDDCVSALCLLVNQPAGQRIFHLCAPNHPSRQALYTEIATRLHLPSLHFSADNTPLIRHISAQKICRELGFVYRYPDPFLFPIEKREK